MVSTLSTHFLNRNAGEKVNLQLDEIKKLGQFVIEKHHKELVSLKSIKEYGINKIVFIIDDPQTFTLDIDEVALINEEILDLINDLIPDGYYLEVSSLGAERELISEQDFLRAIGKYIYISTYQKLPVMDGQKEIYGYLKEYQNDTICVDAIIKTRKKEITIKKADIAKIRLAVNFKECEDND